MTYSKEYQKQLQAEHHDSNWGSTGPKYAGASVLQLLDQRPYLKTILDFGAGKGELGRYILDKGYNVEWTNYDPGISEYDQLPNRQFDLVISTDVLEHVEPEKLPEVLKTLEKLTGKVLYSDIACYLTGKVFGEGPYIGQDLHLIVEDPSWWRQQFRNISLQEFEWVWKERRKKGAPQQRCQMIHERV